MAVDDVAGKALALVVAVDEHVEPAVRLASLVGVVKVVTAGTGQPAAHAVAVEHVPWGALALVGSVDKLICPADRLTQVSLVVEGESWETEGLADETGIVEEVVGRALALEEVGAPLHAVGTGRGLALTNGAVEYRIGSSARTAIVAGIVGLSQTAHNHAAVIGKVEVLPTEAGDIGLADQQEGVPPWPVLADRYLAQPTGGVEVGRRGEALAGIVDGVVLVADLAASYALLSGEVPVLPGRTLIVEEGTFHEVGVVGVAVGTFGHHAER